MKKPAEKFLSLALIVTLSPIFFTCDADSDAKEFNKDEFCAYVDTENIDKTIPLVNKFLSGLSDNLDESQKLQHLATWLKSCPCVIDATIFCVSCVKTLPVGSEVVVSFNENGEVKELNLCILMSNPLRAVRYHE